MAAGSNVADNPQVIEPGVPRGPAQRGSGAKGQCVYWLTQPSVSQMVLVIRFPKKTQPDFCSCGFPLGNKQQLRNNYAGKCRSYKKIQGKMIRSCWRSCSLIFENLSTTTPTTTLHFSLDFLVRTALCGVVVA